MARRDKEELVESLGRSGIQFDDAVIIGLKAFFKSRWEMGEDLSDAWIRGFNSAYLLHDVETLQFAPDYFQDPAAFQELQDDNYQQIRAIVDMVLKEMSHAKNQN